MKQNRGIKSVLLIFLLLFLMPFALAQADSDPKILPDSLLWNLKIFGQDIKLLLTFNQESKLKLRLDYMDERLKEISLSQSDSAIEKAKNNYLKHLNNLNPISEEQKQIVDSSLSRNLIVLTQVREKLDAKNVTAMGINIAISNAMNSSKEIKDLLKQKQVSSSNVLLETGELS